MTKQSETNIIDLQTERALQGLNWVPMALSEEILAAVRESAKTPSVSIIVTAPGVGKTHALKRATLEVPNLIPVTLNRAIGSQIDGLIAVFDAIERHPVFEQHVAVITGGRHIEGIYSPGKTMRRLYRALEYIADRGIGLPVIAIDEAQFARRTLLDCLRSLYDDDLCSLMVFGNDEFNVEGLDPLVSRASFEIVADEPYEYDIDLYLDQRRIMAPKSRGICHAIARLRGIRGVDELLRRARGEHGDKVPSLAQIESAALSYKFLPARS